MKQVLLFISTLCCVLPAFSSEPETPNASPHGNNIVLVSPLVGWNEHTTRQAQKTTLGDWESGLFAMWATKRFVLTDIYFHTAPEGADISGNFLFLNVYGDPEKTVTWNAGAGYLAHWIKVDMNTPPAPQMKIDSDIGVSLVKVGALVRIKKLHMTLNPYLAYAWECTDTSKTGVAFPVPVDTSKEEQSILYGLTLNWHWRMIHLTAKYYLTDNLDLDKQYHVARLRGAFMFNKRVGVVARTEYMEHADDSDDFSVLIGPAFLF